MTPIQFAKTSSDKTALEEGDVFTPRFDAAGLVTTVVTDADDGMLLMVAHNHPFSGEISVGPE